MPAPACVGDCDDSREVTMNELVLAVSIALNTADIGTCYAADRNCDGRTTVDEIVAAANNVLSE